MNLILIPLLLLATPPDNEVVARVGIDTITQAQVHQRFLTTKAAGGAAQVKPLVEDLINDTLAAQDGYQAGLARDPAVVSKVAAERARLAGERLVEEELSTAAKVTDAQLLDAYHLGGDTATFKAIVVASEAEATAIVARLRKGAAFADEAKHSLDPDTGARGGDWGTRTRGQLETALANAVFSAPLGVPTGPVKLGVGVGVVQVASRQLADPAGLAARREDLRRFLEAQLKSQFRRHYVTQLRAASGVKLDEAFLVGTGTRLKATPEEEAHVVATVGSQAIRYRDVLAQAQTSFGGKEGGHLSGPTVKTELAWSLVDRALIEQAAIKRGLGNDAAIAGAVTRFERDEVARARAQQWRASVPPPAAAEVETWYRQHPEAFRTPAVRTCSHLVVKEKAQAEQLKERLKKGETFEELAQNYSLDTQTAAEGGLLGPLTDEGLTALAATEPQLAGALRDAKPNLVSGPTQSKRGWHLLRCGATTPARVRPLDEVRAAIVARLSNERAQQAVIDQLTRLRAGAVISRDQAALARAEAALADQPAGGKP